MPDGHEKIYGTQVIYSNVTRKHSGTYVCEGSNGSGYIAGETRRFAREIGFEPLTTPVQSPQSNGMAERGATATDRLMLLVLRSGFMLQPTFMGTDTPKVPLHMGLRQGGSR